MLLIHFLLRMRPESKDATRAYMADGTSIDALETGDIQATADSAKMAQIMADMNASGGVDMGAPPIPPMYAPPPQMTRMRNPMPNYVPMDEPSSEQPRPIIAKKRNMWSSITQGLHGPVIVGFIFFILSLPMFHTLVAKYATWAFAVGGQLSWIGLIVFSMLSGILFGIVNGLSHLLGF